MKIIMKIFLSLLLASFFLIQPTQASPKYYQYNGDVPFIEMMLNMMATMGMIDKIPPNLMGYGNYMNPNMGNQFTNPPGFNAPNMMQGISPNTMTSPPNFMGYGTYMNPYMGNPFTNQPGFNAPNMMQGINPNTMTSPYDALTNKQTPCVDGSCGDNKTALLNGVWITRDGEILGIENQQFLWSDGYANYLTGQINTRDNEFSLKVQGNGLVTSYQYRVNNNRLQTRDSNGVVRSFIKIPMNQGYTN